MLKKIKNTQSQGQKEYNLLEIVFEKKNLQLKEQIKQIKSSIIEVGFENTLIFIVYQKVQNLVEI